MADKFDTANLGARLLSLVPLPKPDPRGEDWISRVLPKLPPDSFGPFQAGEIPTQALMYQRGISLNPDRLAIPPDYVMQQYFLRDQMHDKT